MAYTEALPSSFKLNSTETVDTVFSKILVKNLFKDATFVAIVPWRMDKEKNGKLIKDRAKANVYINLYEGNLDDFTFDPNEVSGIGIVDTKETLDLFNNKVDTIKATIVENDKTYEKDITREDFLCNEHETLIDKYGAIINKVIEVTK